MGRRAVLFIQGAGDMWHPEGSAHLAAYLSRELGLEYELSAPPMPDAEDPQYATWRDAIAAAIAEDDGPLIIVGHSLGASVLLRHLSEDPHPKSEIRGIFLVSTPWWGPRGGQFDEYAVLDDFGSRLPAAPVFLYQSRDDAEIPVSSLGEYEERLPQATSRRVAGSEHSFVHGLPVLVKDIRSLAKA